VKNTPFYAIAIASVLAATGAVSAQQAMPAPAQTPAGPPAAMPDHAGRPHTTGGFVTQQAPNQWLATQLIGMNVYGPADESLGDVNDVLFDRQGNVLAAVIGVGGFLGVGEKAVAVPIAMVEVTRHNNAERLVLRQTKEQLKAAPEFVKYKAEPAATGTVTRPAAPTPPAAPPAR